MIEREMSIYKFNRSADGIDFVQPGQITFKADRLCYQANLADGGSGMSKNPCGGTDLLQRDGDGWLAVDNRMLPT